MIAKRTDRRQDGKSSFRTLAHYITDANGHGAKVEAARLSHCHSDTVPLALHEIAATQALNTRTQRDNTYHLVVSFPEGERPTPAQLHDIEDRLCEAIGLGGHQRLSALHTDTRHLHLHVAINQIHPESLKAIEPYYDKKELVQTCRELELQHGLKPLQPKYDPARLRAQPAHALEVHSGLESFASWVKGDPAAALTITLSQPGVTWSDVHRTLAGFNLELRARGAGLVMADRDRKLFVKASTISRELSKGKLEARLGPFVTPGEEVKGLRAGQRYRKAPLHQHPEREGLWRQYQAEKASMQGSKRELLTELKQEQSARAKAIQDAFAGKRQQVRQAPKPRPGKPRLGKQAQYSILKMERLAAQEALQAEIKQRRQAIRTEHRAVSWQVFLITQAEQGNTAALATLRQRPPVAGRQAEANALTSPDTPPRDSLFSHVRYQIDKYGTVTYTLANGAQVRDEGRKLRLGDAPDASVETALRMAQAKFGSALDIQGTDAFKRQVLKIVTATHMRVTFTDPGMEAERQALTQRTEPKRTRQRQHERKGAER